MKTLLIIIGLMLIVGVTNAQTNAAVDVGALATNKISIIITTNQWNTFKLDWKAYKASTGQTNLSQNDYMDIRCSNITSNYVVQWKRQKAMKIYQLLAQNPSDDKIDAALQALQ